MDWMCDLYIYACGEETYTVHVAGRRRKSPAVPPIYYTEEELDFMEEITRFAKQSENLPDDLLPIGLPFDGETYGPIDAESAAEKVRELRKAGYICPDGLEDWILEDQAA